jgi:hypothetical protein
LALSPSELPLPSGFSSPVLRKQVRDGVTLISNPSWGCYSILFAFFLEFKFWNWLRKFRYTCVTKYKAEKTKESPLQSYKVYYYWVRFWFCGEKSHNNEIATHLIIWYSKCFKRLHIEIVTNFQGIFDAIIFLKGLKIINTFFNRVYYIENLALKFINSMFRLKTFSY